MSQVIDTKLPSIGAVGASQYQKLYVAKRRANLLLAKAETLGISVAMVKVPVSWEELEDYVKTLKAVIKAERDSAKYRAAYAAKKRRIGEISTASAS